MQDLKCSSVLHQTAYARGLKRRVACFGLESHLHVLSLLLLLFWSLILLRRLGKAFCDFSRAFVGIKKQI